MNRTHAARQLLALGPLSFGQFTEVTGWPASACRRVLSYLVDDLGEASRLDQVYRMTNGSELPVMPSPHHESAVRQGADDVPALLRQAGSQDTTQQGSGQSHAGGDCMAPGKPAAGAGAGVAGQAATGVKA